ncbi:hypothetical protein [Mucilaginibacter aquaedulcis]|uniref:hypothetical protein n=1 Tax=Mucilaginibacter aquaedulcis TaxID=1187081 RepID=UPI0025B56284|nr:hypothetical protein [Mucilaginibacter aquaedulcis]MDN3551610.1 hypothetical protein [Mucilaginibacter aquaedulcis]
MDEKYGKGKVDFTKKKYTCLNKLTSKTRFMHTHLCGLNTMANAKKRLRSFSVRSKNPELEAWELKHKISSIQTDSKKTLKDF